MLLGRTYAFCRITGKQELTDCSLLVDIAQRDFAKQFERGKLNFTGNG
jgi:hypothetical protein